MNRKLLTLIYIIYYNLIRQLERFSLSDYYVFIQIEFFFFILHRVMLYLFGQQR